jgi:hypothetical protein
MSVPRDKLEDICEEIGKILTDADVEALVERATGQEVNNSFASQGDPRKVRIRKTLEALEDAGQERLLLIYMLIRAVARDQDKVRRKIVEAFPATLRRLPQADSQVMSALGCLQELMNSPLSPKLKYKLRPKRSEFNKIVQGIITLFAYKNLHEYLLKLLFTLGVSETLLENADDQLAPNLHNINQQIDEIVAQAPQAVALLGADGAQESGWIAELPVLSASLAAAAGTPQKAAEAIDRIQRMVRLNLSRLNGRIFMAVQEIPFDALIRDPPDSIEERAEFKNLVQTMRDLTATVLARALKNKMWQDAENQISLIASYFDFPDEAAGIADDWFSLRERVDWLAELDPDEQWADQAKKYADDIETELSKENKLDDGVKVHFDAYRNWFRGPFKKIDDTLKLDYGSLTKIDDPLTRILRELGA